MIHNGDHKCLLKDAHSITLEKVIFEDESSHQHVSVGPVHEYQLILIL